MTGIELNLDELVEALQQRGIPAVVECLAGTNAGILAGATHLASHDGPNDHPVYEGDTVNMRHALAGLGHLGRDGMPSVGHSDDFAINADNADNEDAGPAGVNCGDLDITSADQVVDLIIAQTRLPLGQSITEEQARQVLRNEPMTRTPADRRRCLLACPCRTWNLWSN